MTATEKPNLTLYALEMQLMELLNFRDSVAEDPDMTPEEQRLSLEACDQQIAEYIRAEVKKCDGIARYLREFETRAEALKEEAKRCTAMAKAWEKRHDNLEAMVIDIMQATKQTRIDGRHSVLSLRKNPPSADIAQPQLVPKEYQRINVTMTQALLDKIYNALLNERSASLCSALSECEYAGPEPMKDKIKQELKLGASVPGCRLFQSMRLEVK